MLQKETDSHFHFTLPMKSYNLHTMSVRLSDRAASFRIPSVNERNCGIGLGFFQSFQKNWLLHNNKIFDVLCIGSPRHPRLLQILVIMMCSTAGFVVACYVAAAAERKFLQSWSSIVQVTLLQFIASSCRFISLFCILYFVEPNKFILQFLCSC